MRSLHNIKKRFKKLFYVKNQLVKLALMSRNKTPSSFHSQENKKIFIFYIVLVYLYDFLKMFAYHHEIRHHHGKPLGWKYDNFSNTTSKLVVTYLFVIIEAM